MREFFRSWRRKIGVVTILLACVLMGGWFRSMETLDVISVPKTMHTLLSVSSLHQSVMLEMREFGALKWESLEWNSARPVVVVPDNEVGIHCLWRWHGFGAADGIAMADIPPSFIPAVIYSITYWALVIPLTAISGWLLLSKPRNLASERCTRTTPNAGAIS